MTDISTGNETSAGDSPPLEVSNLYSVEITYTSYDRFGIDTSGEPNARHVDHISAELEGLRLSDEGEERAPLGSLSLARIDLWETGDEVWEVLDSESSEWTRYMSVVESLENDPRFLLIVDRMELVPGARGHGIGLHAVARAIRTWGENAVVALTAWPPGGSGAAAHAGGEALGRYWARLGLTRVETDGPPLLVGSTEPAGVSQTVEDLCSWSPPPGA